MFQETALTNEMGRLQKFALKLTKNTHNADDLLQSTVLRALEKNAYFETGTNLFSWTSKIMFNLFITDYRRKVRFESQHDPAPHIDRATVAPSQEAHTDLATVGVFMARLNPEHREILELVCIKGMLYDEAADKLGIPVGTVRSRLSRARVLLQEMMSPVHLHAIAGHA